MNERYIASPCKVFNTVYSLDKRCRPFSDTEDEIELQIRNGVDMGVGLHSSKTAVKIVDRIAEDIKNELITKINEQNLLTHGSPLLRSRNGLEETTLLMTTG